MLPHPEYDALRRRMSRIGPADAISFIAYRSAPPKYAAPHRILSGEGSRTAGGRFNAPGSFAAIYLSRSIETSTAEALAQARRFGIPDHRALPRVFVAVAVSDVRMLDLTVGAVRTRLRASLDRIVRDDWWRSNAEGKESFDQALGRAAFSVGYHGLMVPSTQMADGVNAVLFRERIDDDQLTLHP